MNPDRTALLALLDTFKTYMQYLDERQVASNTRRAYEARLQHFLGFLGSRLTKYPGALTDPKIRDQVVHAYKDYLKVSVESRPHTINSYLSAIDSFFVFLGLGKATVTREDIPDIGLQILQPSELRAFQQTIERCRNPRDKAIAILLLSCAIRVNECSSLNVDDVVITSRGGNLLVAVGKRSKCRRVPINPQCLRALRAWTDERLHKFSYSTDESLFLSNRGTRLSSDSIDHAIRKLAKEANLIGVSSETLRQTCLTNLLCQPIDVETIAKIAGHKRSQTTKRYQL